MFPTRLIKVIKKKELVTNIFFYACPIQRLQVSSPLLTRWQPVSPLKKLRHSPSSFLSAERKAKRSSIGSHSLNPKEVRLLISV